MIIIYEDASVIMIAIKPCGTQIYLFLYIKSQLIMIHTAIIWYGAGVHEKSLRGVSCINVLSMTRVTRDYKMQCLQKIPIKYSINLILFSFTPTPIRRVALICSALRKGTDQPV